MQKSIAKAGFYTSQSRNSKKDFRTQKPPNDPVHLDRDQSEVNTKQSTQWSNDAVCSFTPKTKQRCTKTGGADARGGAHLRATAFRWAAHPSSCFHWWFTDVKYTWCKYAKTKKQKTKQVTGFHASGSQNTEDLNWKHKWLWGITVLVHHRIVLHQRH